MLELNFDVSIFTAEALTILEGLRTDKVIPGMNVDVMTDSVGVF